MSGVLRTIRPQAVRPALSTRYQCLRRLEPPTQRSSSSRVHPWLSPNRPQTFRQRYRTPLACLVLGILAGHLGALLVLEKYYIIPPDPVDTLIGESEGRQIAALTRRIDNEFKVKVLRGKCLGVSRQLKASSLSSEDEAVDQGWVELIPRSGPTRDDVLRGEGLVAQLQGSKMLGVERLFWDAGEKKLVAVVWFGGALSGWPGITHGGAIATQLSEKLALAAALSEKQRQQRSTGGGAEEADGDADADMKLRSPGDGEHAKMLMPSSIPEEPAQLSLTYKKPTHAHKFYIIRVQPGVGSVEGETREFEAQLETMDAVVCVKANAEFESRNPIRRAEKTVVEGVKRNYTRLADQIWPSRQKSSQLD